MVIKGAYVNAPNFRGRMIMTQRGIITVCQSLAFDVGKFSISQNFFRLASLYLLGKSRLFAPCYSEMQLSFLLLGVLRHSSWLTASRHVLYS